MASLLVLLLTLVAQQPGGASAPRVAIVDDLKTPAVLDAIHADVRDAIASVARDRGMVVVQTAVKNCADDECVARASSGADLVLAVSGAYGGKDYVVEIRAWSTAAARWTSSEPMRDDCIANCGRERMLDNVRRSANALLDAAPPIPARSAGAPAITPPATGAPDQPTPAVRQIAPTEERAYALPIALVGAGAAVAAAGVVVWAMNGRERDCMGGAGPCASRLETTKVGLPLVLAGAAAVAAGATLFAIRWQQNDSEFALSVSPGGLVLGGSF